MTVRRKTPLIIIKAATTIIRSRTKGEMTKCILLSYASSLTLKSALREISVAGRITELRDYITKISIKLNSATAIQTK